EVGGHEELLIVVAGRRPRFREHRSHMDCAPPTHCCQEHCSLLFLVLAIRAGQRYARGRSPTSGGALCRPLPDSSPGNAPRPRSCASPASSCAPPDRPTCRCARSLASWASSPRRSTGTSAVGTTCSPCW